MSSLSLNLTEHPKVSSKPRKAARNEQSPPTCAPYTKRTKAPAKSVAERPQNVNYTPAQRLQTLALYEAGIAADLACAAAGVKDVRCIKRWLKKAEELGYDRTQSRVLKLEYVQDRCREGRPTLCGPAQQAAIIEEGSAILGLFSDFLWILSNEL